MKEPRIAVKLRYNGLQITSKKQRVYIVTVYEQTVKSKDIKL